MKKNLAMLSATIVVLLVVVYIHLVLVQLPAYNVFHRTRPFYYAESIDKIAGMVICFIAAMGLRKIRISKVLKEFGLAAPVLIAFAVGLGSSLPMLIGFALTRSVTPQLDWHEVIFICLFSPLIEEIEFRAFGVLQLQQATRWPIWIAMFPSVALFGLAHFDQGDSWQEGLGIFLITSVGAAVFSWLAFKWQNLWVPLALHMGMNLWWTLFSVARTALGGWVPFAMQAASLLCAVIVTIFWFRHEVTSRARQHTGPDIR